jgi:hypothetical protein
MFVLPVLVIYNSQFHVRDHSGVGSMATFKVHVVISVTAWNILNISWEGFNLIRVYLCTVCYEVNITKINWKQTLCFIRNLYQKYTFV